MSIRAVNIRGVIRGNTIELEQSPHLPDGQIVSVTVEPELVPGEGLARSFGGWADAGPELEEFLEQVRQGRKQQRPEL